MKKKIKLVGWSILGILLIAVATLLLARFVFNKQVELIFAIRCRMKW